MFYGHDSSPSWLDWFQAYNSLYKDFMKRQWGKWMSNSLPEDEPLKKWAVAVELYGRGLGVAGRLEPIPAHIGARRRGYIQGGSPVNLRADSYRPFIHDFTYNIPAYIQHFSFVLFREIQLRNVTYASFQTSSTFSCAYVHDNLLSHDKLLHTMFYLLLHTLRSATKLNHPHAAIKSTRTSCLCAI